MKRKRERLPVMEVWLYFERVDVGETKEVMSPWKVLQDVWEERKYTDCELSKACTMSPFFFLPFLRA
jgi:hypothetical protein